MRSRNSYEADGHYERSAVHNTGFRKSSTKTKLLWAEMDHLFEFDVAEKRRVPQVVRA